MIGSSRAVELEVVGDVAPLLRSASFRREEGLWVKGTPRVMPQKDQLSKRYEYTKVGKLLGIATTRFLAVAQGALYYFDAREHGDCLGYCSLENTYVEWLELADRRFLLVVSNGSESSLFYFDSAAFWKQQRSVVALSAILLNFHEDFEVLQELGEGSFARVHRVRQLGSGLDFAAKMISKESASAASIAMLAEERRILSTFRESSYIYQLRQFHQTNDEYVLLMEYLPGVDLMSFIRMQLDLSPSDRKYLLTNILMGVRECHEGSVIHRDLKPQNIIVDVHTYQMKIIDFGLSLQVPALGEQSGRTKCGTVGYMAPQVFCKRYSEKCDMFSFGIIAHLVLMGSNPLKGKNYEQTSRRNQAGNVTLNQAEIVEHYGQHCLTFLRRCLCPAKERYSAEQALLSAFLRESSAKSSDTTDDDRDMGQF